MQWLLFNELLINELLINGILNGCLFVYWVFPLKEWSGFSLQSFFNEKKDFHFNP